MCLGAMYLAHVIALLLRDDKGRGDAHRQHDRGDLRSNIPSSPDQRSIPCVHVPLPEASVAFDEWLSKAR